VLGWAGEKPRKDDHVEEEHQGCTKPREEGNCELSVLTESLRHSSLKFPGRGSALVR
jgi:hypothetical protein